MEVPHYIPSSRLSPSAQAGFIQKPPPDLNVDSPHLLSRKPEFKPNGAQGRAALAPPVNCKVAIRDHDHR